MIVLDTNVLSELLRPMPEPRVTAWVAAQPAASVFTTTVTRAELLYGIALLAPGRRRDALRAATRSILDEELSGRIIPFDNDAADAYVEVSARRRMIGRPISRLDAMIAAMARSKGAIVATRNTRDFVDCGIAIVNPWEQPPGDTGDR
ncbi:type II toxin-antitoxin system VapC family toxin [Cupriavidus sp. H18C1]|uniref:type II toxin-antitoxin system VapC family toxin n=1 Tax=Cupriavidus sp. H18C1 TaxID=3241601 RepID=UPI003BB96706